MKKCLTCTRVHLLLSQHHCFIWFCLLSCLVISSTSFLDRKRVLWKSSLRINKPWCLTVVVVYVSLFTQFSIVLTFSKKLFIKYLKTLISGWHFYNEVGNKIIFLYFTAFFSKFCTISHLITMVTLGVQQAIWMMFHLLFILLYLFGFSFFCLLGNLLSNVDL